MYRRRSVFCLRIQLARSGPQPRSRLHGPTAAANRRTIGCCRRLPAQSMRERAGAGKTALASPFPFISLCSVISPVSVSSTAICCQAGCRAHFEAASGRVLSAAVVPSAEERDLRQLLVHRHKLVSIRTRVKGGLQHLALNRGLQKKSKLWTEAGQKALRSASPAGYRPMATVPSVPGSKCQD